MKHVTNDHLYKRQSILHIKSINLVRSTFLNNIHMYNPFIYKRSIGSQLDSFNIKKKNQPRGE